ncbi:IS1634 family transposase [Caldisericum exile]|uniref:Transposase for insertion sequence element n=1 Tax=Caldisericum exile (strain DSM 21853 / NBRC 104410 / AZM16c01) TaxID=511051 RepID=A0A7U6GEQ3_CALEA|nr:IS1634 family transposase [Caldisericum exile]BAL80248.1 putative transposase for insertion sequence element [Caldisericum exile AZM16c01]BAL80483.1 putative transposase for insertion sequence element [Caldisericum exile AZM16c01]BAL80650.1 putative transposase for insertion sequence element [Caldisericum exile AZM16c01]BAL81010.1 putative transposase for insertion sequence element [Caldisericum exile AZM16c01]BAL81377.1 putative transposase for insertion sequence element [Caldisericum exil
MFVKVTKSGKHKYVSIVSAYRDKEKSIIKHKVILNLGRLDMIENNPMFGRLGLRLAELSKFKDMIDLNTVKGGNVVNTGYAVYKKLWDNYGLNKLLNDMREKTNIQFDLNTSIFLMAAEHLMNPKSKLGTYNNQLHYANLPSVGLNHLYRSLDILSEHKETIEDYLFNKQKSLFNMNVDVVFYDATTFRFESVKKDTLRDFGFSKENRVNEVQVVLGLLIDMVGRPIGYELFPGNTFEGKTLESSLDKLSGRFGIRRVIIVADRGLNSKLNLKKIKDKGYDYIVSSRIKSMKKDVQESILNEEGYVTIKGKDTLNLNSADSSQDEETFRYKLLDYVNTVRDTDNKLYDLKEKLLVTYSPLRAQKDREDRQRLIDKGVKFLDNPSAISGSLKRGGRKYLKETNKLNWELDKNAMSRDEMFDGYYAIEVSKTDMNVNDILDAHHALWKIEESFRIMKSTLEVRPIFHWTEKRIKGHFVVCFLSFLLERTLELTLKENNIKASPERIKEALNLMNLTEFSAEGHSFYLKTKWDELGNKILKILHIKPPKNITPFEELRI